MRNSAPLSLRATAASVAGAAVLIGGLPALTTPAAAAPTSAAASDNAGSVNKAGLAKIKAERRAARATSQREALVRVAKRHLGNQYVAGHAGPRTFDCSGFTMFVYRQATGRSLPHFSGAQMSRARRVPLKHMKPGDLLFYGSRGSQHVSMYIGRGRMIHATNPRTDVRIDRVRTGYWMSRFAGAGRIIEG